MPPQPEGRRGLAGSIGRLSSLAVALLRLVVVPTLDAAIPLRDDPWSSTTGCQALDERRVLQVLVDEVDVVPCTSLAGAQEQGSAP